jgi:hypothetical protein
MADGFGAVQKRYSKWRVPKHLGAEIGFFSVLRIWNQKLQLHPHVHCVAPRVGFRSTRRAGFDVTPA